MSRSLMLVCTAAFLYMLGLSVLFPVLGRFVRDLGLTETQAGALVSVYALASFVLAPVWGWLSQRTGRKPILLLGLVGFAVAFLVFGMGDDFGQLFGARLFGGMLAAAVLPTIFAYVADSVPEDERSGIMGALGAAIGTGVLGGVVTGGVLGEIDPRLPFFATGAIGLVAALGVWTWLPESLTAEARSALVDHQSQLARRGLTRSRLMVSLSPFLAYSFLVQAARSGLEIVIPFLVIDRFAGGPRDTSVVLALGTLVGVAVQGGGVRALSRRYGDHVLLLCGTGVLAVSLLAVGVVTVWAGLLAAAGVLGAGAGLVEPTFRAELSRAGAHIQGEAQGLNSSAQSLARGVAFFVFPALYARIDPSAVFALAALVCVCALMLARFGLPTDRGADRLHAQPGDTAPSTLADRP